MASGEKLTNPGRYIKHPGPSAWLLDGEGLDAGGAMIIDSNLSHLIDESYRHWTWEVRSLGYPYKAGNGWSDLTDASNPSDQTGASTIPWDQSVARRFGPFPALLTTGGANGDDLKLRKMRLDLQYYLHTGAPTHIWHLALTVGTFGAGRSAGVPAIDNTLWYDTLSASGGTSGHSSYTIDVSGVSREALDFAICRPFDGSARGPTTVAVLPVNFWIGIEAPSSSYQAEIHCVSLFEVP